MILLPFLAIFDKRSLGSAAADAIARTAGSWPSAAGFCYRPGPRGTLTA